MTDLMEWAAGFTVPNSLDAQPKNVKFTAETLPAPAELRTDRIRGRQSWRRPGGNAVTIDAGELTASKEAFGALGLALFSYALSAQTAPLRIHLAESSLAQIVVWPGRESRMEARLGFRIGVREVHYRPTGLEGIPTCGTDPEEGEPYPREHLPYVTLSPPDWSGGYPGQRPDLPLCMHLAGTSPSLVWLGKLLLNLAAGTHYYFYNVEPGGEELAYGGAELGLDVTDPPTRETGDGREDADSSRNEPAADDLTA